MVKQAANVFITGQILRSCRCLQQGPGAGHLPQGRWHRVPPLILSILDIALHPLTRWHLSICWTVNVISLCAWLGFNHPRCSFPCPSHDYFNIRICCFKFYNALQYIRISFGFSHFYALCIYYIFTVVCIHFSEYDCKRDSYYLCLWLQFTITSLLITQRMLNQFCIRSRRKENICKGYANSFQLRWVSSLSDISMFPFQLYSSADIVNDGTAGVVNPRGGTATPNRDFPAKRQRQRPT